MGEVTTTWEERAETVRHLVDEAARALEVGQAYRALWRLVDAAGMVAEKYPQVEGARRVPTGRGYYVGRIR